MKKKKLEDKKELDVKIERIKIKGFRKKIALGIPCIIKKKIDDLVYPNARFISGRWLSFKSTKDLFTEAGIPACSVTAFTNDGGSLGRLSQTILAKLYRVSEGYLNEKDIAMSLQMTAFCNGNMDFTVKELETLIEHYEACSLPVRHALYASLILKVRGKKNKILSSIMKEYKEVLEEKNNEEKNNEEKTKKV